MKKHIMLFCLLIGFALGNISAQSRVRIAVLDFRPGVGVDEALVDGISEMLISSLFDTRRFTIIERTQINAAIQEQGFQRANITTGQIAQVGRLLGVEYVLVGIINFIVKDRTLEQVQTGMASGEYNIDVRIVNVQSGEVVSTAGTGVRGTETIRSVMPGLARELVSKIEVAQAEGVYKIGDFGPAGGVVFFDKGNFSNGWRYLEAAPFEAEFMAEWGALNQNIEGLRNEVGFGKANTQIIIGRLNQLGETGKAAQLCAVLNFDGYNDWFLPSIDELKWTLALALHANARTRARINQSKNAEYYSSSTITQTNNNTTNYYTQFGYVIWSNSRDAFSEWFYSGSSDRNKARLVRAIRAF